MAVPSPKVQAVTASHLVRNRELVKQAWAYLKDVQTNYVDAGDRRGGRKSSTTWITLNSVPNGRYHRAPSGWISIASCV